MEYSFPCQRHGIVKSPFSIRLYLCHGEGRTSLIILLDEERERNNERKGKEILEEEEEKHWKKKERNIGRKEKEILEWRPMLMKFFHVALSSTSLNCIAPPFNTFET